MKKVLVVLALSWAGCASAGNLVHDPGYGRREPLSVSLLKDEKAALLEEAIQRLLASRIGIAEKAKLTVFLSKR